MRIAGFVLALVVLPCTIQLRAQELEIDSLVAVRPFGEALRYTWPIVRMPGDYAIARRINRDLYMWNENYVDADSAGLRFFDEVWGTPPEASQVQLWPPEWHWARPVKGLLEFEITAEWCGAYCEGGTQHYQYDLRDGSRVWFDSLFTREGARQVKTVVDERWRKMVEEHLASLRDSVERLSKEGHGDWYMEAVELYESCLEERSAEEPYVGDMQVHPGGITVRVARCSVHANRNLDDLGHAGIELSRKELVPLMRKEVRRWLGW